MAFLEDPRLRQRWNQISHNAEGVAENAAAGIWSFQHRYIEPCFAGVSKSLDACTGLCLGGDSEERARRARERERGARRSSARPEFSFDFYDDWDDDDDALAGYNYYSGMGGSSSSGYGEGSSAGRSGGILGADWDRLLAGTGSARRHGGGVASIGQNGEVLNQPRRKRSMSYGTRGQQTRRKKSVQEDPTIIPSTSTFGFLGRLPFKIGGTLRYKPSAANLRDHPGADRQSGPDGEQEPLLGAADDDSDFYGNRDDIPSNHAKENGYGRSSRQHSPQRPGDEIYNPKTRKRSNTAGSGATSDSYRSRGDLFPSDGEGEEDAVPLDDEFTIALDRVDDRSSGKTRISSKKGKRRAGSSIKAQGMSRSVSRTTIASEMTTASSSNHSHVSLVSSPVQLQKRPSFGSVEAPLVEEEAVLVEDPMTQSLEDLRYEEQMAAREEAEDVELRRKAANHLAVERGLGAPPEVKASGIGKHASFDDIPDPSDISGSGVASTVSEGRLKAQREDLLPALVQPNETDGFTPAKLPNFR
ncbi:hypothetical protein PpBr36_07021 [Pyricularia pennisetigena]|uniref:hypothetical protein n=1 Tax=Pyricularia pennisetigena TaxID=1578925 RepID=UPI0011528DEF|nr:hypothetical protein PpBr36_07021 [Pyricularia pennisetigena]TLS25773.1 hypothetical protein PpBr36_07021 [Pyricularia pennisetigena]